MIMKTQKKFTRSLLTQSIALLLGSAVILPAMAQEATDNTEVIQIKGVRGSLSQSMNIKRQSSGVVDAITAVDMGKFPDTNLAESLQRITGVSINRVNGEGSEVTVRGFGGGFNLVTLNGRQMPAANVGTISGNPNDKGATGSSRSFDFANLASEGVSGIEVFKTGRASITSGGIGAAINIKTLQPLDQGESRATVGIKAVKDESGDGITPELSGVTNWINEESTFGVALFGSFQERDSGSRALSVEQFVLRDWAESDLASFTDPGVVAVNPPTVGQIVAIPSNIGLGVNNDNRERTNAMLTVQFAPMEDFRLTFDALYAKNEKDSTSVTDGIWFSRQFSNVEFDGNPVVSTPVKFSEDIGAGGKDFFFQNLKQATKDELKSFGFNADYWVSDSLNLTFDAVTSEATSGGNNPGGYNTVRFNMAGSTAGFQTVDFTRSIPQASIMVVDPAGNQNGIFDKADIGSQVTETYKSNQTTDSDQVRLEGKWTLDDYTLDFGVGYISTSMAQTNFNTQDQLGGWGASFAGDIPEGLFEQSCTSCAFEDHDMSGVEGADALAADSSTTADDTSGVLKPTIPLGSVSFSGDPVALLNAVGPTYGVGFDNLTPNSSNDNKIEEEVLSAFVQLDTDYYIGDMELNVLAGLRYEKTDVTSSSNQVITESIDWLSDNDFITNLSAGVDAIVDKNDYTNLLPSLDLTLNVRDDIKARFSYSKTLARPAYDQLYQATALSVPQRITALGGSATASKGNAQLSPLESTNIDLSLEWYYSESSVISIGYYTKDVKNFVGTAQNAQPLFGILDPTSADSEFTSQAITELDNLGLAKNETNLFTMTAILQNPADFPGGAADFEAGQTFATEVFNAYDVYAVEGDPLREFQVTSPVNNKSATIDGFEVAWQHFFGETGFGYQANYTTVNGDIGYDNAAAISVDQFALEGLSDTANLVLIYEKDGLSTRIAYNWRDEFLSKVNRGFGNRNPVNVASTSQIDINASYNVMEDLTVSLDIINLTEEGQRQFGRSKNNVFFVQEADRRFVLSASYNF
jgi:TonB-dependent receptor